MKSFTWFAPPNRRLSSKADLTAPPTAPGPADEPEVVRFWECGSEMKQDWSELPAYSVGPSSQWCLPHFLAPDTTMLDLSDNSIGKEIIFSRH